MTSWRSLRAVAVAWIALAFPAPAAAVTGVDPLPSDAVRAPVLPGSRVRVTILERVSAADSMTAVGIRPGQRIEGVLLPLPTTSSAADPGEQIVSLEVASGADTVRSEFSPASIASLEVLRPGSKAGLGAALGLFLGGAVGYAWSSEDADADMGTAIATGALLGVAAGTIAGKLARHERWEEVPLSALAVSVPAGSGTFAGPRPRSGRPGFLVFENTYSRRLAAKPLPTDGLNWMTHWQLAYLDNTGAHDAWGGGMKLTLDGEGHRLGPVLRYRRWLDDSTGLDVSAGAYVAGHDNKVALQFPAPTVDLGVSFDDWIGIHAGLDVTRRESGGTHFEPYLGVRFGRVFAPITTVGLGLLLAAAYSSPGL